jgi:head-tail adaptor
MRTGQMRHKITIQSFTETIGDDGHVSKSWSTLMANVPCSYEQVSGGEIRRGRQIEATATALFTLRYVPSVNPKCRISFGGNTYGIVRVNAIDGQTRYLEIQAAVDANG